MADTDCLITEAPETPSEEPQLEPVNLSKGNQEGNAIDEATREKLKGDQIGETMYNQSFVLKTLMRFGKLEDLDRIWSEDMETDLCFLWDMTTEEDVCKFLFELDFPVIACDILAHIDANLSHRSHRLIEILIGILGNICIPKSSRILNDKQLRIVLHEIDTDDHLILVQLMRFVEITAFKCDESVTFINTEIMEKIVFILYNSINVALLENTLNAVDKLTSDCKLKIEYLHENLLEASFTAFKVIYDSENESDTSEPYKTDVVKRNINHLLQILVNLSVYCNKDDNQANTNEINAIVRKVDEHRDVIFNEFLEILKSYDNEYDVTDDIGFVFTSIDYIFPVFNFFHLQHYELTIILIQLTEIVKNGANEDIVESFLSLCKLFLEKLTLDEAFFDYLRESPHADKFKHGLIAFRNCDLDFDSEMNEKLDKLFQFFDE